MDWEEHLKSFTPKKARYMSIKDSVQLLKEWHNNNGLTITSHDEDGVTFKSFTQQLDEILTKKINKINTIVLYGDSNAGKSIVLTSAFKVFPDLARMYQGISNNFMFECLEDCSVCLWEEALFAPSMQETIKQIIGGEDACVASKYRKNVPIGRVPIGITCNVLPWTTILQDAHQVAFQNRCIVIQCKEMPSLEFYADKGKIHPVAWLHVDPGYWARKKNATQNEEVSLAPIFSQV